jgi:hypothetical protein
MPILKPSGRKRSRPPIAGYARERLLLCGKIITELDEGTEGMFMQLIKQQRAVIDAVAAAQPGTWSEVRATVGQTKKREMVVRR